MRTEYLTIPNAEKLNVLSNLSTMVNAGLTVAEAVESLLEDATGPVRQMLIGIQADITQGKPLHTSMRKYPRIFDSVTVALIKAAEESGTIDVVLRDIKNTVKKDMQFTDKIKSALTYPTIIILVFFGVLLLLLTFVIPKIADVFIKLRVELPLPTRILIFLSNLLLHYTIPVALGGVVIMVGLVLIYKRHKSVFMDIVLGFPYIATLARQVDLTRFSRSLYLLLISAIPLYTALELVEGVAMKKEIRESVARARDYVGAGRKLADGLRGQKAIPSLMVKIIEVGERSGSLDHAMEDLAEYFDYRVTTTLAYVVTLLEPIILVVVGVFVGSMMMAIMAPIYNLIGQVGNYR